MRGLVLMLCVIVKVYSHASAGMRCIASRTQHAKVYCVVLKDSALIGGKQSHDMSEWGRGGGGRWRSRGWCCRHGA